MAMTIEELAQINDMPTWQVAQGLVRLMKADLVAPPDGVNRDAHIAHLEAAYPKPGNVKAID